jgi:membrane peptidoglycan carboxypeptidase
LRKTDLYLLIKKRQKTRALGSNRATNFTRQAAIGALAILLILLTGTLAMIGVLYAKVTANLPSLDELPVLLNPTNGELLQPTRIMDRSGQTVLYTLDNPGIARRYLVIDPEKSGHFSPQLVRAVIAKLDPTFWQNPGYSLKDWQNPEPATIAERLVSDLLLWDEPSSTTRAIRMRLLAAQLVSRYGRTQMLEWYLNSAYFGHRAYGAESAAQLYFKVSAQDLTLAESAMLTVLIDAPALNPLDAPTAALDLQRQFLAEMTENLVITTDEFTGAIKEELPLRTSITEPVSLAPAFTHHLLPSLEADLPHNRLERGGLVVQSTLDLGLQQQFLCTSRTQLARLQGIDTLDQKNCPAALLLPTQVFNSLNVKELAVAGAILNPQNGEVLAYIQPVAYDGTSQPDTGYQPGSLLSPFVALAGFARGLSPASLQWDVPYGSTASAGDFKNPDGQWRGPTDIRAAVANDYLVPMAAVANQVGPANAWNLASVLGMSSMLNAQDDESALFSGQPTTLLDVASAYSTLANSGVRSGAADPNSDEVKPNLVLTVKSTTGHILLDRSKADTSSVLSQPLSYLINNILSDESARWPSLGYPNPLEIGQPAAAKLGVIASKQQVWTVGYTPDRLVLVWMGNTQVEQNSQPLDPQITAGVWHAMMKQALTSLPLSDWPMPDGVTKLQVCTPSGMLPSADCPNTMNEVFLSGNEPTRADTLYEKIKVNRETSQRATVFTDPALVDEQLFINVPADARQWAINAGLPVAPSGYDAIPITQSDPDVTITSPALFAPVSGKISIKGTAAGSKFTSYTIQTGEGINPATWLQVGTGGTSAVRNGELALWDTSGLDGLYAIRLIVVDQDQAVKTATIQVTVDNTPPSVKIDYPAADQQIRPVNNSVTLQADIEDSSGLARVEWWLDGKLVLTQTNAPYVYLMPASQGSHTLQVTAVDNAGNTTKTNAVSFAIVK